MITCFFFWALSLLISLQCGDVAALRRIIYEEHESYPRVYLVTFGSGSGCEAAATRLAKEANDTKFFDGVFSYTDFPEFILSDKKWQQHVQAKTGAGFWFWKGPLISHALNQINDGDVLLYADSGCEIGNVNRFKDVAKDLCDHDMIAYSLGALKEKEWTKGDIFSEFSVTPNNAIYGESGQILATYFWMKNTAQTRQFIQHWENLLANYHLISDENSTTRNAKEFRTCRRDQSLFSMLMKANQPDCNLMESLPGGCPKYHPLSLTRHTKYGVPGFRAIIRNDVGYPAVPRNSLILSSRNHGGHKTHAPYPTQLTVEEASAMKRQVSACK